MESQLWAMLCILLSVVMITSATTTLEVYWQTVLPNTTMPKPIKDHLQSGLDGFQGGINHSAMVDNIRTFDGIPHLDLLYGQLIYLMDLPPQLSYDPVSLMFFLEKDLNPSQKIILDLKGTETKKNSFLPRQIAETISFSSSKLPDLFNQFSITPESFEAKVVKTAIMMCEFPAMEGEEKYCATSLESMIDFATSKLGPEVTVMETKVNRKNIQKQEYNVGDGIQKIDGVDKQVVCHEMKYMYTVFYCHSIEHTTAHVVPLVGADGTEVEALALCHEDTSAWNPEHVAFKILNVKPGTDTICHFLRVDTIVWIPK